MEERGPILPGWARRSTSWIDSGFSLAATLVIDVMALFSLVALIVSTLGVGRSLVEAVVTGQGSQLTSVIVDILTVFILVEVLAVSVRFLRVNRIDVRDLIDVTLAIIFREIWVGMFSGSLHWQELVALSALVIACGGLRVATAYQDAKNRPAKAGSEVEDAG